MEANVASDPDGACCEWATMMAARAMNATTPPRALPKSPESKRPIRYGYARAERFQPASVEPAS
jgi:hypothetical protein